MRYGLLVVFALACGAQAQRDKTAASVTHEAAEDAARTVPGGASKGVKACHEDIERFCLGVKPGEGRLGKCLKANRKKLSAGCRRWLAHGGSGHVDRAFQEIDVATTTVAGKGAKP